MFRGANKVTLDAKGRLAMPTRYRERIVERSNGRLIATVDRADRCLLIYPLPEWEEIELKLRRLPTLNPLARRLQRLMIGHATDLDLDGSGRILIPPSLREYAGLSRTAMLIATASGSGRSLVSTIIPLGRTVRSTSSSGWPREGAGGSRAQSRSAAHAVHRQRLMGRPPAAARRSARRVQEYSGPPALGLAPARAQHGIL